MKRLLALTATLSLLGGCALSPQMIEVRPQPEVPSANVGNNAPVAVTVVDSRDGEAFGTRGGVYKDTALIRPANDLTATVTEIVRSSLQKQGFNAYNPPAGATDLEVRLETVEYVPESGTVVNRVNTRAVIRAVASREDVTHQGVFKSKVEHELPLTPTAKQNRDMITGVLTRSLERMLADPKLLAFLAGEDDPSAAEPKAEPTAKDSTAGNADEDDNDAGAVVVPAGQAQ